MDQTSRPQTPAPSVLAVSHSVPKKEEKSENKENSPPPKVSSTTESGKVEESQESQKDKSCARCTKRRLADVQPQSNGTLCESTSPNKRARHDSDSSSGEMCNTKSTDVSSSCHEPMQTEQITNLVNRFNSGLSGLLGSSENTKNNSQNDSSIVPFCGTQVTFSESLGSRPVIALAVWLNMDGIMVSYAVNFQDSQNKLLFIDNKTDSEI